LPLVLPETTCAKLRADLRNSPGATVAIDLETQSVTTPAGETFHFDIRKSYRERLLRGLNEVGLILERVKDIEEFEKRHGAEMPWLETL
jgi:3-isopropylmalate/(R)-2-methylmalate dehydratase small subunit